MRQVIFYTLLLFSLHAFAADWGNFYGNSDGNQVKLYWEIDEWPQGLSGFILKKKSNSQNQWQQLNTVALKPSCVENRDWANQGLAQAGGEGLEHKLNKALINGHVKLIGHDKFIGLMKKHKTPGAGFYIRTRGNFNIALMTQFALVDPQAEVGSEYGLFFVDENGRILSLRYFYFEL